MARVMVFLSFLSLISLAAVVSFPAHGNEVCLGCREEHALVQRFGFTSVAETTPNACSRWIAQAVPDHEHRWSKTGCWDAPLKSVNECFPVPAQLGAPARDWLAYLKAIPHKSVASTLAHMQSDESVLDTVAAFDFWRTQQLRAARR